MQIPAKPDNEAARLSELERLGLLYTPAEERFDRVTRLACRVFQVPVALVTLVADECQWFKSAQGIYIEQTPRDISFCGHAILGEDPLIIEDAQQDPRFHDNPLVTGDPFIRFYAGCPISGPKGHTIGTLCLIDSQPRTLSDADINTLIDLAAWVENEIHVRALGHAQAELLAELDEARRQALIDPLTRLWNRRGILDILHREIERAQRRKNSFGIIMADIDHFKNINDRFGHPVGDDALRAVAKRISTVLRGYDTIGRYGGEEFLLIISEDDVDLVGRIAEKIRRRMAKESFALGNIEVGITLSLGVAMFQGNGPDTSAALIARADKALYEAKDQGRNRIEIG